MTVHPLRPPKKPKPPKVPTGVSVDEDSDEGLTISLDFEPATVHPFPVPAKPPKKRG
ncbi:MAG: hypothetical protein Q8O42_15390 [Acidobacteriota bacterium]|nr:hypothetical protein [Acidobacteriota bacterium]